MERTRDIYSSNRQSNKSYKIDCAGIPIDDTLHITIIHSAYPDFIKKYTVAGKELIGKNSIHFNVIQTGNEFRISWMGNISPKPVISL